MSEELMDEAQIESHEEWASRVRRARMVVSPFQARAALQQAGLLQDVEQYMSDPDADPMAVLAWQNATEFRRLSALVATVSASLGLTAEQLDDLFRAAAALEA
ncbi:hypothetical protein [Alloalcanivorax xenomutans]